MAASNISVTQGSGTRLATNSYTEGGQTVHDEKVILGEQYLPTYVISGDDISTAATGQLFNVMAGASLRVRIRRIEIHQRQVVTTAAIMKLRLIRLTTAGTGGTSVTPRALDPADPAPGVTAMTIPTAGGAEGSVMMGAEIYLMQTLGASTPFTNPVYVFDFDSPRAKPLIIAAGTSNGITLKAITSHAGGLITVNVICDESSF